MVGFYSILMFLFFSIRKEAEIRHGAQISALQLLPCKTAWKQFV